MRDDNELKKQKYISDLDRLRKIREKEREGVKTKSSPDIYDINSTEVEAGKDLDISIVGSDYRYNRRKSELEIYPVDYNARTDIKAAGREHTPHLASVKRAASKVKKKNTNRDKVLMYKSERKIKAKKEDKTMKRSTPPRQGRAESGGKKKKKGFFRTLFLLLLLGIFAYFAFIFFSKQSGYYTIAIFGVDSRNGNLGKGALADVNIICNINRETNEI